VDVSNDQGLAANFFMAGQKGISIFS